MKTAALLMTFSPWIVLATLWLSSIATGTIAAIEVFPVAWVVISPFVIGASIFVAHNEGRLSNK